MHASPNPLPPSDRSLDDDDDDDVDVTPRPALPRIISHIPGDLASFELRWGPLNERDVRDWLSISPTSSSASDARRTIVAGGGGGSRRTLVVNDVDRYHPPLADWIYETLAETGGGIGPHVDDYDVFLIQMAGTRTWRDDRRPGRAGAGRLEYRPRRRRRGGGGGGGGGGGRARRIIAHPGDMLYLPPRISHCGTATSDDCMTLSVGCRAPSASDLMSKLGGEAVVLDGRFPAQKRARGEYPIPLEDASREGGGGGDSNVNAAADQWVDARSTVLGVLDGRGVLYQAEGIAFAHPSVHSKAHRGRTSRRFFVNGEIRRPSARQDNAAVPGGGGGGSAVAVASRDEDHDNHVVEWNDAPSEASGERQRRGGGFSARAFASSDCWGRRPLLIRGAFDPHPSWGRVAVGGGVVEIMATSDFGIEVSECTHLDPSPSDRSRRTTATARRRRPPRPALPRIISHIPGDLASFELRWGPLNKRDVRDWLSISPTSSSASDASRTIVAGGGGGRRRTLVVNDVDRYHPPLADWMYETFDFLPNWRMDDGQISLAETGGGIGPHVDDYDVFLIQMAGTRTWRVGRRRIGAREERDRTIDGLDVRVLGNWNIDHDDDDDDEGEGKEEEEGDERGGSDELIIARPGDMLYLPPRISHCGTATSDDCMTLSVGCRAPSASDLISKLTERLSLPGGGHCVRSFVRSFEGASW
ncbi:hypothetical protein ACHAW5_010765 [Stephanodiscus triporus]|uniref:Bifunctional lysine-specific demethylase and histidyl-hydroxylase n=1 Tax=Stephanodiscus triporus TaxID=2934178 RepID=A0ABD3NWN4_9STRA